MRAVVPKSLVEDMYLQGLSTYKIAETLGLIPNTVRRYLWDRRLIRQSLSSRIEFAVANWLGKQMKVVEQQKGDAPFDILCDGERIDVKSSHKSTDGCHRFELSHTKDTGKRKKYTDYLDSFYLVFLDLEGLPVYRLDAKAVVVGNLKVKNPEKSKYPLEYLGDLRNEVI